MKTELTSRERIRLTLEHKEADRVPIDLGGSDCTTITEKPYEELKKTLGIKKTARIFSTRFQTVFVDDEVQQLLHSDVRPIAYRPSQRALNITSKNGEFFDEWGIGYRLSADGLYYDIVSYPLAQATIDDLETYDWPDPYDPKRVEGVAEEARYWFANSDYALLGPGVSCSLFEQCWYLRGFEQFLLDLLESPDFAHALLRKVLDIRLGMYGKFLEQADGRLDLVYVADDISMQTGPMMSPQTYREIIKPYHKEYFKFIKENSGAKLFYHCCGNVEPFIEDLIEIGVDALNPVQLTAKGMDPARLKEKYGSRITFWGGVDTQRLLPKGTPEQVEAETKRLIDIMSPGGGYVLSAVHNIQADTGVENILTMLKTGYDYGRYGMK